MQCEYCVKICLNMLIPNPYNQMPCQSRYDDNWKQCGKTDDIGGHFPNIKANIIAKNDPHKPNIRIIAKIFIGRFISASSSGLYPAQYLAMLFWSFRGR